MLRAPAPEVLILGSSRSMQIAPSMIRELEGRSAFNGAVDSARAEDLLAVLRYALEDCKWRPREVLMGLDIEALHNHLESDPSLLIEAPLRRHLSIERRIEGYAFAAESLISYPQALDGVRALDLTRRGFPPETHSFGDDGAFLWVGELQRSAPSNYFEVYDGRFAGYTEVSTTRWGEFTDLVSLARAYGATVRVFITPMHPELVAHLRAKYDFDRLHADVTVRLARLVDERRPGVTAVDFQDIASFGGSPDDFYDGAHMLAANARRLLIKLLKS
jgi:hypothetical protein